MYGFLRRLTPSSRIVTLLVLTTSVAVVFAGCGSQDSAPTDAQSQANLVDAGEREIPIVTNEDIARIIDEHVSQPVVVNFWATWCPPCIAEIPEHKKFYEEFAPKGIAYLSFSADHPTTIDERVRPFIKEQALPFPIYVMNVPDPASLQPVFDTDWDGALPATFLIAEDGTVANSWFREVTREELAEAVAGLIAAE